MESNMDINGSNIENNIEVMEVILKICKSTILYINLVVNSIMRN